MSSARVRVNGPDVMHETIDGEVIIINLTSGNYYSVRGVGSDIWTLIAASPSVSDAELVGVLRARYECEPTVLATSIRDFISDLQSEGLVAEADPAHNGQVSDNALELADGSDPARPFAAPKLEKYTDLQDLVLLDPVHQVDQTGWPAPAPDAAR